MMLVGAQAIAEIFLSAVLGMYMTQLYTRHRPVRLARNPTFLQFDEERARLEQEVAKERLALAEAKGEEGRLEHQMTAFIAYARSLFQRELALRRDRNHQKRLVLDDIAEQFKKRLAAVDFPRTQPGKWLGQRSWPRPWRCRRRSIAEAESIEPLNPQREVAR